MTTVNKKSIKEEYGNLKAEYTRLSSAGKMPKDVVLFNAMFMLFGIVIAVFMEKTTKIDIIFEKVVTHLDAEIKTCNKCGEQTKAKFPSDMKGLRNMVQI